MSSSEFIVIVLKIYHWTGRFEEAVIEERRKSAIDLLVFVGGQPHLYNSKLFDEFLKVCTYKITF